MARKKNGHDTLKVEDGNTEDFFPLSCLTKSFENVIHISNVHHRISRSFANFSFFYFLIMNA